MCEHKNLRTVNDCLFCKDCGQQLPLSFLTDRGKKKDKNAVPSPAVHPEELPEGVGESVVIQETPNSAEIPAENPPVESQTDKSSTEKKPRKNAKKGA